MPRRRAPQRPSQAGNRPVLENHRRVRPSGGLVGEGRHPLPLPGRLRAVNRLRVGTGPRTAVMSTTDRCCCLQHATDSSNEKRSNAVTLRTVYR